MNLIVNRQLDPAQKRVIYELTLKKRQSKKSTMSEKHVAARQQLARELMLERKVATSTQPEWYPTTAIKRTVSQADSLTTTVSISTSTIPTLNQPNVACDDQSIIDDQHTCSSGESVTNVGAPSADGSCGCSFGRSESSYSGSSEESSALTSSTGALQLAIDEQLRTRKKEASIKFNKTRLEHLNEELEKRLHQYEYLVAQEKALLGTYNIVLFTSEGVNNFHLHDNRRVGLSPHHSLSLTHMK